MNKFIILLALIPQYTFAQCQLKIDKEAYKKCIKSPDDCKNAKLVGDCIMKKFRKCASTYRKCEE